MKNLLTTLLTGALGASIALGATGQLNLNQLQQVAETDQNPNAYVLTPDDVNGDYNKEFIRLFNDKGVKVVYEGQGCETDAGIAWYWFDDNQISICEEAAETEDTLQEMLMHEAVHLVQDCRAGINNSDHKTAGQSQLVTMHRELIPQFKQFVAAYEEKWQEAEIEAYYFQQVQDTKAVWNMVQYECPAA